MFKYGFRKSQWKICFWLLFSVVSFNVDHVDTSVFIESTGTWTVHVQCNVTRLHGIQIKLVL